jgi:stage V sporulation protein AC
LDACHRHGQGQDPSKGCFCYQPVSSDGASAIVVIRRDAAPGGISEERRDAWLQQVMSKEEYKKYVDKKSPNSKLLLNASRAFLVGGLICAVGQFFSNSFRQMGFDPDMVSSLTAMTMVFLGVLFSALNLYDDLGKFAGAGSIVPITGFANSIVSPAMEYRSEGYVLGIGARMFLIAGPVLVYGITASVIVGIIHYLIRF